MRKRFEILFRQLESRFLNFSLELKNFGIKKINELNEKFQFRLKCIEEEYSTTIKKFDEKFQLLDTYFFDNVNNVKGKFDQLKIDYTRIRYEFEEIKKLYSQVAIKLKMIADEQNKISNARQEKKSTPVKFRTVPLSKYLSEMEQLKKEISNFQTEIQFHKKIKEDLTQTNASITSRLEDQTNKNSILKKLLEEMESNRYLSESRLKYLTEMNEQFSNEIKSKDVLFVESIKSKDEEINNLKKQISTENEVKDKIEKDVLLGIKTNILSKNISSSKKIDLINKLLPCEDQKDDYDEEIDSRNLFDNYISQLKKLTVQKLKIRLKKCGLSLHGRKAELIERLSDHYIKIKFN